MPLFNRPGTSWVAGFGGDGVPLVCDGVQTDPGPGGAGDWLNDTEIVSARWTSYADFRTVAIVAKTGAQRVLRPGVSNGTHAGGGRWAAANDAGTWVLDDGSVSPYPVIGFADDGTLLTQAHPYNGTGLIVGGAVIVPASSDQDVAAGRGVVVTDVQFEDAGHGMWRARGVPGALGLPVPVLLGGESYGLRWARAGDGRVWVTYQASGWNGQAVLHPADSWIGYALTPPGGDYFRADMTPISGVLWLIWSNRTNDESLAHIVGPVAPAIDARFALVDLAVRPLPPEPEPEPPKPEPIPPEPEPEPPKPEPEPPQPEPEPEPQPPEPEGPTMITVDLSKPLIPAETGEKVQNPDGTVSVKCPEGYLSVDSTGAVKFAPGIGPDESFHDGGTGLVVVNTFNGRKVWILPYVETA